VCSCHGELPVTQQTLAAVKARAAIPQHRPQRSTKITRFPQPAREETGIDGLASQRPGDPSHTYPHPPPSDDNTLPGLPAATLHGQAELSVVLAVFSPLPPLKFRFCRSSTTLTSSTHTTTHHHHLIFKPHRNSHGPSHNLHHQTQHVSRVLRVRARPWQ